MNLLPSADTPMLVQGITGRQGRFHTLAMKNAGTNIVAGVTPGKGGHEVEGIHVYDSIGQVAEKIEASVIFVPKAHAKAAALEAIDAGLDPVVLITEHIPVWDTMELVARARAKAKP